MTMPLRVVRRVVTILLAAAVGATPVAAQRPGPAGPRDERSALERRFRERLAAVVQQRLGLSDAQMRRLAATNRTFDERRRLLLQQERDARMAIRDEILAAERANQDRVAELLDRMLQIQRQRIDLLEEEQRELATFMSPVQRARYLALQDDLRRRMEALRRDRRTRPGEPPPRAPERAPGVSKTP